jgi:hypothetical protein
MPKKVTLKSLLAPMREYDRKFEKKYLRSPPTSAAKVPEGKVVVHNHVIGGGFRMWRQLPDDETLEVCRCGWSLKHYRVRAAYIDAQPVPAR